MADEFIIAATGCPTGVAHTFMAEAALIKAAKARGIEIKVETHGQIGIENELTPEEIARATGVIIAADKDVQAERFADKPLVETGVKAGIHDADALITQALEGHSGRLAPAQAPSPARTTAGRTNPTATSSTSRRSAPAPAPPRDISAAPPTRTS